jgi:hypothetical protein
VIVECAWCGSSLGHKDGLGLEGVSSGICDACFAALERLGTTGSPDRRDPDEPGHAQKTSSSPGG